MRNRVPRRAALLAAASITALVLLAAPAPSQALISCLPEFSPCGSLTPDCCDGLSCISGFCIDPSACQGEAEACTSSGQCCGDRVCHNLFCRTPVGAGEACGLTVPCEGDLVCDLSITNVGLVCRHDPPRFLEPCSLFVPCGPGLQCALGISTCVHDPAREGEPCEISAPCGDGLFCQPGIPQTCQPFRTVGEGCFAVTNPCMEGLSCEPCFTEGCSAPFQCFPNPNEGVITAQQCLTLYSPLKAMDAMTLGTGLTYGAGVEGARLEGMSFEVGVAYSPDGRYGCYTTECAGVNIDLSAEAYASIGFYNTYNDVRGDSFVTFEEAMVGAGGQVNFSTSQVFASIDGDLIESLSMFPIGTTDAFSIGVSPDIAPISGGIYMCSTILDTVIGNDPPEAVCTNVTASAAPPPVCTAEASVDGGSFDPDGDPITLVQAPAGPYTIGTRSVTLTATDDQGDASSCSAVVSVLDDLPPTLSCPAPTTAECQAGGQASVDPGDAVADDCSSTSVTDPGSMSFPVGETTQVDYTATDAFGNQSSCSTSVTVVDTTPPDITCPAPTTAECTGDEQAVVDPGDATVTDCTDTTATDPGPASYPVGTTEVEYTATDAFGNSASCSTDVSVIDTAPPVISSLTASPDILWPPNHNVTTVEVVAVASDVCDPTITCGVVGVASSEPDTGLGGGDPPGDVEIVDADTVRLRAERGGEGGGRVYTITFACSDDTGGNTTQATTTVTVPHDQGDL